LRTAILTARTIQDGERKTSIQRFMALGFCHRRIVACSVMIADPSGNPSTTYCCRLRSNHQPSAIPITMVSQARSRMEKWSLKRMAQLNVVAWK
jgi:hypothetical protein